MFCGRGKSTFTRYRWLCAQNLEIKDLDIDTIGIVDKGVYMVRMKPIESRDKAYKSNGFLFDNKPFVIKPWTPEMSTDKTSLSSMPI